MRSETINLNEEQTNELKRLAIDPLDEQLAKRAQIILKLAEGSSVREVAKAVGLNKDAVTRWKKRYLNGGIEALRSEHGGGVVATVTGPNLQGQIKEAIDTKTDGTWTRTDLAKYLGTSLSALNYELKKMNITLSRNTSWEFATIDELSARSMCVAGLFMSGQTRCIVLCTSNSNLLSGREVFITRNRLLAEDLRKANSELTLRDVLWTATDHADEIGKKNPPDVQEFLNDIIEKLPDNNGTVCYAIGVSDEPLKYRGKKPGNLSYQAVCTPEEWEAQVERIFRELCAPSEHASVMELLKAIHCFGTSCKADTDPFIWKKDVQVTENDGQETVVDSSSESFNRTKGYATLEEAILNSLEQKELGEKSIEVAMIPVIRDKDGIRYRIVKIPEPFPDTDAFEFSSPDGFMRGFNQMEEPMILLRNETGKVAAQLFVDAVKKNSIMAE